MKRIFYILPILLMMLTSCSQFNKIIKPTTSTEYRYEAAKEYYIRGDYSKAAPLLEGVIRMFKGSKKAEESLFMLGMCYYESQDYSTAAQYFKMFYTSYPRGEYAELARFYSGKSLYMGIAEPELDQTDTHLAIQEMQLFIEYFPASNLRDKAQDMMFEMHDVLVKKDLLSAQLYYELGDYMAYMGNNYQACIITAQNALKDYPYTKYREDLSILVLRAKYKMAQHSVEEKKIERYRDAIDEYYSFKNEFPGSKHIGEAEEYYKESVKVVNE
ncbi:MAG: outer membrane protein assembly factor BamD [Bacteroidaceae bacterium]|nr:outer membrane protein assembly factor BamD [Bacteroidaceae bacterium]